VGVFLGMGKIEIRDGLTISFTHNGSPIVCNYHTGKDKIRGYFKLEDDGWGPLEKYCEAVTLDDLMAKVKADLDEALPEGYQLSFHDATNDPSPWKSVGLVWMGGNQTEDVPKRPKKQGKLYLFGVQKSRGSFDDFFSVDKYKTLEEAYEANDYVECDFERDENGIIYISCRNMNNPTVVKRHTLMFQNPVFGLDYADDCAVSEIAASLF